MKHEDKNVETIETYDVNPEYYAEKFKVIGDLRKKDVDIGLSLIKGNSKKCLEIGCGSGKDAQYLLSFVDSYVGLDASEGMLKLARNNNQDVDFKLADMRKVDFPLNSFDIIFAFASFLHLNDRELLKIIKKSYLWLNSGGVLYMTMKYGLNRELEKKDVNGNRFFYFYTPEEIRKMAESIGFAVVYENRQNILGVDWFELALRKE